MKIVDLSGSLLKARSVSVWSVDEFRSVLKVLCEAVPGARIDWDHGAGEEWGRIVYGGAAVSLLWLRIAFCFVDKRYAEALVPPLLEASVEIEVVEDWDEGKFRIEPRVLLDLCGRSQLSWDFDSSSFSALDLWCETV